DHPIADILLQGGTWVQNHVISHFRVGGTRCHSGLWISITGSRLVITRRHLVITEHLQWGDCFVYKQPSSLSARAPCSGWLCTAQPTRSVCLQ
ncbi:unnamed protein product, partial [Staurois parvus]